MNRTIQTSLQLREVFHLEYLRWFTRKLDPDQYVLKGGVNLRFFFDSIRYSEDMDIDVRRATVASVQKITMGILTLRSFAESLRPFGIVKVVPPDVTKAKQTETTQRFKVHLLTITGENLFTKIELSRRKSTGAARVEPVSARILRLYKMAPLLVSHYDAAQAIIQKIHAIAGRSVLEARDIFDLFLLIPHYDRSARPSLQTDTEILNRAHDRILQADFRQFRDTVVAYLEFEDQKSYSLPAAWDEIRLKTDQFLEELRNDRT